MLKIFLKSLFLLILIFVYKDIFANTTVSELEAQIQARNQDMQNLQSELNVLRANLIKVNQESRTLGGTVLELDTTRKKLLTEIKIAEEKIGKTSSAISILEIEISQKGSSIDKSKNAIAQGIRRMHEIDSINITHKILSQKNFSDLVNEANEILDFQKNLQIKIQDLRRSQTELGEKIEKQENEKEKLLGYRKEVDGQKQVVEVNKKEKEALLRETKNQEAEFQKIIAEKERLRAQFEAELIEYESRLSFILDPKSIPVAKHGVLAWPLDKILITQGFGLTADSARLYSHRQGAWQGRHTGIDFRANNDPVKSMSDGVVVGFGNTDTTCPRASFGGWVLLKFDNGLAAIYSHLATFNVKVGQRVKTGDVIAYSGNTGYSTGPHLDVKVVPASAVTIETWPSKGCPGKNYTTPIVAGGAYLDPLSYLPKTTEVMWK